MKFLRSIEVLARGVCVKQGKLLVCRSLGASNTYLPGGHIEFREQAADSLAREIREEMGVRVRIGRFLGAVENTFLQKGEVHAEVNFVFEMTGSGLDPKKKPVSMEDHIEFRWVELKRLNRSRLEPAVLRSLLPAWLKRPGPASRWARGGDRWIE